MRGGPPRAMRALSAALLLAATASGADVLLPQGRWAFTSREPIEIAVTGLPKGERAEVALAATGAEKAAPVKLAVTGDGGAVTVVLPPNALAPADYRILLDGVDTKQRLAVRRGVHRSTMYVSQTGRQWKAGGNFIVSNAFSFGLPAGEEPSDQPRKMSGTFRHYNQYVADDVPALIYMYWTGYVTHKPWGTEKEWCSADMTENMRLFNLHVAQRLRRFHEAFLSIGSIDEPGLPWGKTPAGGSASGFPNWNTRAWYEERGWRFTNDPASRPDDDWMKYLAIRRGIIGEQCAQARKDIHRIWPEAVYSQDCYALHAMMDGTDSWNQHANDRMATHVFVDWGYGKLGTLSAVALEKAARPTEKVAHAMNGQLFGTRVPQPQTRYAYHLMLNSLLAAGITSNWWLNTGGMGEEDLVAVNGPAERIGPLFARMARSDHDTALLWSVTELALRLKPITALEAKKPPGETLRIPIPDTPETAHLEDRRVEANAYSVGSNYRLHVLAAHQALVRAGYPAHIVDERLLPQGILERYKTLVVVGQTFALPPDVRQALEAFAARGGAVVVDEGTSVKLPGAVVAPLGLQDLGHRWGARFNAKAPDGKAPIADGLYQTNYWADHFARDAVAPLKEAMKRTPSRPVMDTGSAWLGAERHVAGQAELHLVINAHEKLGKKDEKGLYYIYNYAPYEASFRLPRIQPGQVVYCIEGLDWKTVRRVPNPAEPQSAAFQPGEMKLYLALPAEPAALSLKATAAEGVLTLEAAVVEQAGEAQRAVAAPIPLAVTITDPEGGQMLSIYRATGTGGVYREALSLGRNAPAGPYRVRVTSPIADLKAETTVQHAPSPIRPRTLRQPVRVFDEEAIRAFLAQRPALVVPYATAEQRPTAERIAAALRAKGFPQTTARLEELVWRKALYPRVWDPYIEVHKPTGKLKPLPEGAEVTRRLTIESDFYDTPTVLAADGEPYEGRWNEEGHLLTVGAKGFIEITGMGERFYTAGCTLFVGPRRRLVVLDGTPTEMQTTGDVRALWARPWKRLGSYVGAAPLIPQLPEATECDHHLVLFGTSGSGRLVRTLQASELLLQVADAAYPGPGKALVEMAWSPFCLGKNVLFIGASDSAGVQAGLRRLLALAP